jgi:hypothetical protein
VPYEHVRCKFQVIVRSTTSTHSLPQKSQPAWPSSAVLVQDEQTDSRRLVDCLHKPIAEFGMEVRTGGLSPDLAPEGIAGASFWKR